MKQTDYEQLYRKTSSDGIEEHYSKHVDAMTREGLRAKYEIALELAARDAEIHRLKLEIENLEILYARDTAKREADSYDPEAIDAERYRYIRRHMEWRRSGTLFDGDIHEFVGCRFPLMVNFACAAMLDHNIDKMIEGEHLNQANRKEA